MAGIKLQSRLKISMIKVERSILRNEHERRKLNSTLCIHMENLHRILPVMELILVKFVVFVLCDVTLALCPKRLH